MLENDADVDSTSPTWMSFADLMTGLLGAFVLLLVGVMAAQLDMASKLEDEVQNAKWKNKSACRWNRLWPFLWPAGASL